MKLFYFISVIFFLCNISLAQQKEWINLTNGDMVTSILDAGDSILWIGTDGGLVKFNKTTEEIMHYNRANAKLPGNHIRSMVIDSSGALWMGTKYSGVGRFDGSSCQSFNTLNSNLPHNQWNIAMDVDTKGNIYFSSLWYFSKYDGKMWQSFATGNLLLSNLAINDIKFDKNDIGWLGASWGLGKYENGSLTEKFNNFTNPILSIEIDSDNNVWLGTDGKGIHKFNGQNFSVFDTTNSGISGNIIYDMEFDQEKNLWISTEKGISKFDGTNWQTYNSGNSEFPKKDFAMCIKIDKDNIKWFGTKENGLYKFNDANWKKYNLSNSIISNHIYDIDVDSKNNIYLGGYLKGLFYYDRNNWHNYKKVSIQNSELDLSNKSIETIYSDKYNNLYINLYQTTPNPYSASSWLIKYNGTAWLSFDSTNSPFSYFLINSIVHDKENNMWLGTNRGIMKYNGTDWKIFNKENTPLSSNYISDILFDKEGNLWAGIKVDYKPIKPNEEPNGGLAKYDGSDWVIYDTSNSAIPYNDVSLLRLDSNNNFWLACWEPDIDEGYGLTKFNGKDFVTYNMENSEITSNKVNDIAFDKEGNLWLATSGCMDCKNKGELIKFDGNNNWLSYNQQNSGIAINYQTNVKIDSFGNKWIGHLFSGVSVFREGGLISSIKSSKRNRLPQTFQLLQNYPNPFNPVTTIEYTIPQNLKTKTPNVVLRVYDVLGRRIATLVNTKQRAGNYSIKFDASDLTSGMYFYKLEVGKFSLVKKMLLLK